MSKEELGIEDSKRAHKELSKSSRCKYCGRDLKGTANELILRDNHIVDTMCEKCRKKKKKCKHKYILKHKQGLKIVAVCEECDHKIYGKLEKEPTITYGLN